MFLRSEVLAVRRLMDPDAQQHLASAVVRDVAGLSLNAAPLSLLSTNRSSVFTLTPKDYSTALSVSVGALKDLDPTESLGIMQEHLRQSPTALNPTELTTVSTIERKTTRGTVIVSYAFDSLALEREHEGQADLIKAMNGATMNHFFNPRIPVAMLPEGDSRTRDVVRALEENRPARISLLGAKVVTEAELHAEGRGRTPIVPAGGRKRRAYRVGR